MSQYLKAVELALEKHVYQKYGRHPYVLHLYEVADVALARNLPKDWPNGKPYSDDADLDKLLAVCYLHDIVEDTDVTIHDLDKDFTISVVFAVDLLTKDDRSYEQYINDIRKNWLAREVKICDTIANLSNSVKDSNHHRIAKYSKQLELLMKEE